MSANKHRLIFVGTAALLTLGTTIALYRLRYKLPLRAYTAACLYLAVLDDEICRNELADMHLGGTPFVFPPRRESLPYRYRLFLQMNRGLTRADLDAAIQAHEQRLAQSNEPRTEACPD